MRLVPCLFVALSQLAGVSDVGPEHPPPGTVRLSAAGSDETQSAPEGGVIGLDGMLAAGGPCRVAG